MSFVRGAASGVFALALLATWRPAVAQTTDAYHAIQVLPVVVDTASFSQRFYLHNPSFMQARVVTPTYYPASGTAQLAPVTCPTINLVDRKPVSFNSLRQMCPGLAAGSMFGTLVLSSGNSGSFAVYSRVNNAAGAGFSVEAFPASDFSGAITLVTGLRRSAATPSSPAFQTNCFAGVLGEITPAAIPAATDIKLELRQDDTVIGSTVVSLLPGKLVRLLDVFAAVGDANHEYDHALAEFTAPLGAPGGLISFCTVQENTGFGADFRIGKQVQGDGANQNVFDFNRMRDSWVNGTPQFNGLALAPAKFEIPPGASANTHAIYFRHPDYVGCSLINTSTGLLAAASYGLEMRLLAYSGDPVAFTVLAGGNEVAGFSGLYLGDKADRPNSGNLVYFLQVESNGQNEGSNRPYALRCQSGSGHTLGELIQTGGSVSF